MKVVVAIIYLLVGSVQEILFHARTFLVVEQSQIVGILAHHRQRAEGVSEAVPDGHALEPGEETFVVSGFAENFLSDGGGVLAAIALSENEEGAISFDA